MGKVSQVLRGLGERSGWHFDGSCRDGRLREFAVNSKPTLLPLRR